LRYHVLVCSLAQSAFSYIRQLELLHPGHRLGVAVSGGIDSVALLRLLLELRQELGVVLSVVHFNHKLRAAESDADQEFVADLARKHGLEFYCSSGDVAGLAAERHSGIEAASRELRYEFFRELLVEGISAAEAAHDNGINRSAGSAAPPKGVLDKIATGHTLDDQAETVLMRMIRGAGMRGLGGIYPRIVVGSDEDDAEHGEIIRPLLGIRRCELERYLSDIKQPWREDATNSDPAFTRNRVRKLILPTLEKEFNPAVVESLSVLAEIARDEEDYWENEVLGWLGTVVQWSRPDWTRGLPGFEDSQDLVQIRSSAHLDPRLRERLEEPGPAIANASLSRPWLLTEPRAVQRRVLKAIGEQAGIPLEFKHVEEILRFAAEDGPAGKELALPLGWKVVREAETMVFVTPDLRRQERIPDYEYPLQIPGRVVIPELGSTIEVVRITSPAEMAEYNPQQLLREDRLKAPLTVRNWRPGDRFWPAHTKSPKKIKELLQERHVAQPERRLWPVVLNGDEIVWMRGFAVPAKLGAGRERSAVLIREHSEQTEG
jgi:tRNA(Ile)-lysidine synthase